MKARTLRLAAAGLALASPVAFSLIGGGTAAAKSEPYAGQTITVMVAYPSPPQSMLNQFTKETGIHVKWVNVNWDTLQTKIAASMAAGTYFADATDVDWSKAGEYYRLKWFVPLNKYFPPAQTTKDFPMMGSFIDHGQVVAMPFDSSFMVTTVNGVDFKKAGIKTMPTTLNAYVKDLQTIKAKHIVQYPLDIPYQAAEGLSTYWYEVTGAFGGHLLSASFQPLFAKPSSPGYKAMQWMVNQVKDGLVAPGNVNLNYNQGFENEMAQNKVASVFQDNSGQVATIYDIKSISTVVNQVQYIPTPGINGVGPNLGNPDGIGIPKTAKHVGAAVTFIKWFDSTTNQALWAGYDNNKGAIPTFPLPARISSMRLMVKAGQMPGGREMLNMLEHTAAPVFPAGAPPWYPQWSSAVYTNLHAAAAGQETVKQAIANIVNTVNQLRTTGG